MIPSLLELRAYTAHLFAKALAEMFPQVKLKKSEVSEIGFTSTFVCPQPLSIEILPLLEERMRGAMKNPPSFRIQEMVPANAARLFRDKGQPFLEERCLHSTEELISVICLGNFCDISLGMESPPKKSYFTLIELTSKEGEWSVFGTAFPEKEPLKVFVKKYKEAKKNNWTKRGAKQKIFALAEDEVPLWWPKGLSARRELYQRVLKSLPEGTREVMTSALTVDSLAERHAYLYRVDSEGPIWEWTKRGDSLHVFLQESEGEAFLKSSLQLIDKTRRIFGFEHQGILCGLTPPKFESRKRVKARWKTWVDKLKQVLESEKIGYGVDESRSGASSKVLGPYFKVLFYDALGLSFPGPEVGVDLLTLENLGVSSSFGDETGKVILSRSLFPEVDRLLLKVFEARSWDLIFREQEK